jgi:hypothetical protein
MLRTSSRAVRENKQRGWRAFLAMVACAGLVNACKKPAPVPEQAHPVREQASAAGPVTVPSARALAPLLSERVKVLPEVHETCHKICERSTQLKCRNADECLANCYGMASLTPCSKEFNALFPCLLREPLEHWECGEDGIGAIRAGYCDAEQSEAVACMEKKMQP